MRIITLGTGAGRPSVQRNASAMAIEHEGDILLFDCGEGTQTQLMRSSLHWGRLEAIFIGHLHGDHVNGLPGLLATLSMSERKTPLRLCGPKGLKKYLRILQECKTLWIDFPLDILEIEESGRIHEAKRYWVEARPLDHVIPCWGYRFQEKPRPGHLDPERAAALGVPTGPLLGKLVEGEAVSLADGRIIHPDACVGPPIPGRSVAYCCDTKPCQACLELGDGVDWLVHEATFDASMEKDAVEWGHSTNVGAARIASEAKAKQLLLTHISQRYQDGGEFLAQAQEVFGASSLAADLETIEL